jgi:hypothetical protein
VLSRDGTTKANMEGQELFKLLCLEFKGIAVSYDIEGVRFDLRQAV